MGSRAALVPLAVIVTVVAAAAVVRLKEKAPTPRVAPTSAWSEAGVSSALPPLRGVRPALDAGAAEAPPMLHGDARHTNRAHAEGPHAVRVAWSVDVGGAVEAQVVASRDAQTLYAATLEGALFALARDTGETRWRADLGGRAYATPCVGPDGTIYAGSDAKKFRALTPDGKVVWTIETDGEADTGAFVAEGLVVFAAGRSVHAARKGGDVAWRFEAKGKVFTAPALAKDLVVFGSQDHHAYAVRVANGQLAWSVDLGADVDGAPAVGDAGESFFGTDGDEVVRVEPSGAVAWRTNVGGFVRGALSVARNGDVLAGVYGPTPRQVRIDGATGALQSGFSVPGTGARELGVHGGATEDDRGALFFGAQDDVVYAIAPEGTLMWSFAAQGDVDTPITLLPGGAVAFGSDDGHVYLLTTP
jgi:outer membrane protein assembly factor BamB